MSWLAPRKGGYQAKPGAAKTGPPPPQLPADDGMTPEARDFLESAAVLAEPYEEQIAKLKQDAQVNALVFDRVLRERDALRRYVGDQVYEAICGRGSQVATEWLKADVSGYFADVRFRMKGKTS